MPETKYDSAVQDLQHARDENFNLLGHVWDEYKYRHGKCWEVVYRVGPAVFALGAIPYVPAAKGNPWLADIPALMAAFLAVFGWCFADRELCLFRISANTYIELRKSYVKDPLDAHWNRLPFSVFLHFFMFSVFILSLVNIYVAWKWNR